MKFQLISDGSIPVPPNGWGALERVVWIYKLELEKLGHEVLISNYIEDFLVLEDYRKFKPDIVHNHIGKHWIAFGLMTPKKKIFTNHGGGFRYSIPFWNHVVPHLTDSEGFVLTEFEKSFFIAKDIKSQIIPNGVYCDKIKFSDNHLWSESIYLGKIMKLKRQSMFQKLGLNVVYVGNPEDNEFDYKSERYLGTWMYDQVCENLTKFANLVLLSQDELQPLVCLEAMSAGLGLVISEPAAQSLDISKPWISVISENDIQNIELINSVIEQNKKISISMRKEIKEYASTFDWSKIISSYVSKINI